MGLNEDPKRCPQKRYPGPKYSFMWVQTDAGVVEMQDMEESTDGTIDVPADVLALYPDVPTVATDDNNSAPDATTTPAQDSDD